MVLLMLGSMAQGQWSFDFGNKEAEKSPSFQITVDSSALSYKPGEPFFLAMQGHIDEPWHAYFRNPGTVGEAMRAELDAPAGFQVEGPFWQVPQKEEGAVGVSYAYSGDAPLVVWRLTPAADAPEKADFTVSATAQLCHDEGCTPPQTKSAAFSMERGPGEPAPSWGDKQLGVEVLGDVPVPVSATQTQDAVQLSFSVPGELSGAYFFSDDNSIHPVASQLFERTEDGYRLTLPRNDGKDMLYPVRDASFINKELDTLKGLLVWEGGFRSVHIPFQKETLVAQEAVPAADKGGLTLPAGFAGIIGSLFLGGLILNLMPCVFPVISLKIMGFVELGGGERRKVFLHSLAYVLGILLSFWILSLALVVLSNLETLASVPWTQWVETLWHDTGSDSRTWAPWMQDKWVVYGILLLLLVLGLSMFGVFEIGVSATGAGQGLQNKKGLWGSFFQGLLVTVVATPCSAPILGAALAAALALPAVWMMAALTFMALGLAFPYVALGLFPRLVKMLPRPGAWMESLKQGLSFLLFAAAAWILYVYLSFIPESHAPDIPWMLMSLVVFCAAFWVYGRWCPLYRSRASRIWGGLAAIALAAVGVWGSMPPVDAPASAGGAPATAAAAGAGYVVAQGEHPVWNEWSKEGMERALAGGHPVFVDFTAKWCATCLGNKKLGYNGAVYAQLSRAGAVLMRADKTHPNEAIDAELRRLNRSSVPVNALYIPGRQPAITREVFTASYLLDFLKEHLEGIKAPMGVKEALPGSPDSSDDEGDAADGEDPDEDFEAEEEEDDEGEDE